MRSRYPYGAASYTYSFGPGPMTPAIKALIIANVVVFVAMWITRSGGMAIDAFGLTPEAVFERLQVWRVATYMFLHGGLFHILFNMLALWMFGVELERIWGSRYFLKYYFVCGIGAAVTMLLLSLVPAAPLSLMYSAVTVGASGAIYGILLAFALYFPHRPIILFFFFPVPARWAVTIMGAIALLSAMEAGGGVAHVAHLGGLAAGYLYLKGYLSTKGGRVHLISEIQYRILKWRINRARRRFDVYSGGRGRADDVDRRVH